MRQALAVPDATAPLAAPPPLVAELLLRACGIALPQGGAMPRVRIDGWRHHPLHRETAAAPVTPIAAGTAQDPAHPETAAVPAGLARPLARLPAPRVTAPGRATPRARQEPMHRDAPAACPAAAIGQDPSRQQPATPPPPPPPPRNPRQEALHLDQFPAPPRPVSPLAVLPLTVPLRTVPLRTGPLRTGPLRNGNPRGNPNAAPRCGARTRSGCPCRAPAMHGKLRCRMHGGGSTGPRTAEGLAHLRAAHTTHGRYTGELRIMLRHYVTFHRRGRINLAALQLVDSLPPAARTRLHAMPPELRLPPYPSLDQPPPSRAEERAFVRQEATALAPWKQAIAFAIASRRAEPPPAALAEQLARLFSAMPPPVTPPANAAPCQQPMHRVPRPLTHPPRRPSAAAPVPAAR
ncbi:MAG TPA: HGGxSTG domain-containing protein [Acetobacteraceae bacterium]|nr:HGGxSTG domain-containing protein [Acetobacteraceae bacterium]